MAFANEFITFENEFRKPSHEISISNEVVQRFISVYKSETGKQINTGCITCLIEGFFELKNKSNNQLTTKKMQNSKFKLKENTLPFIGFMQKFVNNATITDEIAIAIVKHNAKNASLFAEPQLILDAVANENNSKIAPATPSPKVATPVTVTAKTIAPPVTTKTEKPKTPATVVVPPVKKGKAGRKKK